MNEYINNIYIETSTSGYLVSVPIKLEKGTIFEHFGLKYIITDVEKINNNHYYTSCNEIK
jgi:hypothetical protein